MTNHTKVFFDYFGIDYDIPTGYHDYIYCEKCGNIAVDIHHIKYKSQGGTDEIENLIALCRDCHDAAHAEKISKDELFKIHKNNLE